MEATQDYQELGVLGKGSYGTVYKCRHKTTNEIVAVKAMDDDCNEQVRKTAIREARILKQLQHPNVVRLLELFRSKTRLYMVFEYMDRSILKLLEGNPRGLPTGEVKRILWQLVLALNFLHSQSIIHRDIKPENVLIDERGTVKLCDFGFARPQAASGGTMGAKLSPYVATRWYRAPELLVGDKYGPGVDIWALGCLLVELATGQPLFPGKSNTDQLWLIMRGVGASDRQLSVVRGLKGFTIPSEAEQVPLEKRFAYFDKGTLALLKACLSPEPRSRPTCGQLLTHEYFASVKDSLAHYTAAAAKAQVAAKEAAAREAAEVVAAGVQGTAAAAAREVVPERAGAGFAVTAPGAATPVTDAAASPAAPLTGLLAASGALGSGNLYSVIAPGAGGAQAAAAAPAGGALVASKILNRPAAPQQEGSDNGDGGDGELGGDHLGAAVTGSDDGGGGRGGGGGGGEDDDDDEDREAPPELSAMARQRINAWLQDIPEPRVGRVVNTVTSIGGAGPAHALSSGGGGVPAPSPSLAPQSSLQSAPQQSSQSFTQPGQLSSTLQSLLSGPQTPATKPQSTSPGLLRGSSNGSALQALLHQQTALTAEPPSVLQLMANRNSPSGTMPLQSASLRSGGGAGGLLGGYEKQASSSLGGQASTDRLSPQGPQDPGEGVVESMEAMLLKQYNFQGLAGSRGASSSLFNKPSTPGSIKAGQDSTTSLMSSIAALANSSLKPASKPLTPSGLVGGSTDVLRASLTGAVAPAGSNVAMVLSSGLAPTPPAGPNLGRPQPLSVSTGLVSNAPGQPAQPFLLSPPSPAPVQRPAGPIGLGSALAAGPRGPGRPQAAVSAAGEGLEVPLGPARALSVPSGTLASPPAATPTTATQSIVEKLAAIRASYGEALSKAS